ncbi:hypothetical protein [Filomicrobium sp.]|uniref:hypothetical protein n=1 Tax=Filomicrobium sp. TaxID=2024831 RepID=UPI0025878D7C|nr:hypothetical protein [Filomicrobium sp.]MCV0368964.1 hypothetical protein [Filomicrobium sp.]
MSAITPIDSLRFSEGDLTLIDVAARQFGQSRLEFMREAVLASARQVSDYWHLAEVQERAYDAFMPII